MRNALIFAVLLAGMAASAVLAVRGTSRMATVEGSFAEDIRRIDYHRAYLLDTQGRVLDSCLILNNRFTLVGRIEQREARCRIVFSGLDPTAELLLRPQQTVRFHITAEDPYAAQYAQAVEQAIARLDSAGYIRPDTLSEDTAPEAITSSVRMYDVP